MLLEYARSGYLGQVSDDWSDQSSQAKTLAHTLAEFAKQTTRRQSFHSQDQG